MALAAVGSNPSSRTTRTRSRISFFTSLTSLSAFAVAALEACLRRCSAMLGVMVPAHALLALCGQFAALTIWLGKATLTHLLPTFLLGVGGRSGVKGARKPSAVRPYGGRPPP